MASSISSRSSSSSISAKTWTYEVFLSFRGEDTRKNFVDHLYEALDRKGIRTFKDDKKLRRGESIGPELLKAIEESRCVVVVFSKNYANSSWCLAELAKIMECRVQRGQKVFPVFYYVDPFDVRRQRRSFYTAFQQHEKKFKEEMDKVKKWREALTAAANLSGWDVAKTANGHEAVCIRRIVSEILRHREPHPIDQKLVGMELRVQELTSLLDTDSNDVRRIGIWGMGGIGKTTIARAVFRLLKDEFEGSSFLEDIRQISSSNGGLKSLQEKLLSEILMEKDVSLRDCDDGAYEIQRRLGHKKVLLVLDDVNHVKQLEFLAASSEWPFGPGSRVIVTTRDERLLHEYIIYKPGLLDNVEATKLFCRHAFNRNNPLDGYEKVTTDVVKYTGHLPLALKVLGSHLRGRELVFWGSAMKVLDKVKNIEIHEILKLSFDGLNILEKNMFLDIACFFKGKGRDRVTKMLDCFGFEPISGIQVLIEKSLVTIDSRQRLQMHDLIQEMGRHIASESYTNSRLWLEEEISEVMRTNTRLEAVEAIMDCLESKGGFNEEVFRSMKKLRLLHVFSDFTSNNPTHLPDELRWLSWGSYPFHSFSLSTATGRSKLACLHMKFNCMEQLSLGETILHSLKFINLTNSFNLTRFPDVSGAPNLERLILSYCKHLVKVHESVGSLKRLVYLNLSGCKMLKILPSRLSMESLQTLILSGCRRLERFPEISGDMGRLSVLDLFCCSGLKELPSSFRFLTGLTMLDLRSCSLECLPNTTLELKQLPWLCLGSSLEELDLSQNMFTQLPASICHLSHLKVLKLDGCEKLEELTELPLSIQVLKANECTSLKKTGDLSNEYRWLYKITLLHCPELLDGRRENRSYLANLFRKSFMMKCAVVNHRLSIGVPGRNLPDWFSNQKPGNRIALKLPPSWHTTIKGFAICYVFPEGESYYDAVRITFELQDDQDLVYPCRSAPAAVADDNFQVWMGYIPFDLFEQIYHDIQAEDWSQFKGHLVISSSYNGEAPTASGGCIIYKEEVEQMAKIVLPYIPDCDKSKPFRFLEEDDIADVLMKEDSIRCKTVNMEI